jgi:hypothetical protein
MARFPVFKGRHKACHKFDPGLVLYTTAALKYLWVSGFSASPSFPRLSVLTLRSSRLRSRDTPSLCFIIVYLGLQGALGSMPLITRFALADITYLSLFVLQEHQRFLVPLCASGQQGTIRFPS